MKSALSRERHARWSRSPSGECSSGCALDGARTSFGGFDHAPQRRLTRGRAPCVPGGVSRSMNPSDGAPSRRCFRPCARRKNLPLTLPVAASWSRNSRTSPGPLLSPLRQKKRLSRPGTPSTDELPTRCIAFTMPLEREPATVPRTSPFAAGFRRSFALRYDEEGLDSAASAGSSPAGARCHTPLVDILQSKRSASTTGESMEPILCARTTNSRPLRDPQEGSPAPFRAAKPSGHGSGAESTRAFTFVVSSSRRACARRELCPNPIGSDTSCRGRATSLAGGANAISRTHPATSSAFAEPTAPETCFRFVSSRAASRAFPRRNTRFAAPEVPSVAEPPPWGGPFLHTLSPACGVGAWRLCYLRSFPFIDV